MAVTDDKQEAFSLFDEGLDAEDVAERLGIDPEDAASYFKDWENDEDNDDADGFAEPEPEDPIDYDMPDTWAYRCGP
tara:strand:- start:723 stop:953 length:231 start_codon:yes stop_codon:yes gene_type:complete